MSQRSAFTAAAIATAEVSEPPRPSVVIRPSGVTPWKPAMTAISPVSSRSIRAWAGMSSMRARAWAVSHTMGICQPSHDRAFSPMLRSTIASRPAVTCSPEATTTSYSSSEGSSPSAAAPALSVQATSSLVRPLIAETTTATGRTAPSLATASAATSRPTRRMRSRSATDVPPNFITSRDVIGT